MSMKVNVDKKKFTKTEGQYLLGRPWLTSPALRKRLQKTFASDEDESDDSGDGGDQE